MSIYCIEETYTARISQSHKINKNEAFYARIRTRNTKIRTSFIEEFNSINAACEMRSITKWLEGRRVIKFKLTKDKIKILYLRLPDLPTGSHNQTVHKQPSYKYHSINSSYFLLNPL